ncbi:hypothetical protein HNQ94_003579 [Salirhabdus euzebyi]|uniref:YfhE family protein n=1 Tax=Salirhabdus euzebyi TaxID=394506 RepID=A0A841Q9W5_9BACI|nr:hypothetical protein [Salirhabdus euzebyi]
MGKERKPHDSKNFNISKTQQVLYQREFKMADKAYERAKNK